MGKTDGGERIWRMFREKENIEIIHQLWKKKKSLRRGSAGGDVRMRRLKHATALFQKEEHSN